MVIKELYIRVKDSLKNAYGIKSILAEEKIPNLSGKLIIRDFIDTDKYNTICYYHVIPIPLKQDLSRIVISINNFKYVFINGKLNVFETATDDNKLENVLKTSKELNNDVEACKENDLKFIFLQNHDPDIVETLNKAVSEFIEEVKDTPDNKE